MCLGIPVKITAISDPAAMLAIAEPAGMRFTTSSVR